MYSRHLHLPVILPFIWLNYLIGLLEQLQKLNNPHTNDLVFKTVTGKRYQRLSLHHVWKGQEKNTYKGKKYHSVGVITRLVEDGKIACYLKPYSTRHTFITIQANAGVDLKLLADSCGTSVDVIYNHYLGTNKDSILSDS